MTKSQELKAACESIDAELDRQFGNPDFALSEQALNHLAECPRCRELYDYLYTLSIPPAVSPQIGWKVEKTLQASLQPVKPVASTGMLAVQLFLVFLLLAVSIACIMKPAGLQAMAAVQLTAISLALLAGGVLLSLSLAWQMIPGSLQRIPAPAAIAILAGAFVVTVAALFPWHRPMEFFSAGLHCLILGTALAIPAAVLMGIVIRRGAPVQPAMLGAALGAMAGLSSLAILQANCPMQDAIHLLVWHGAVLALSIFGGFLIGRTAAHRA